MALRNPVVSRYSAPAPSGVTTLNSLSGAVTLAAGHAIAITTDSGTNTITTAFNGGLDDLSDVDLSGVVTGDVLLKGPGSNWINFPLETITSTFVPYTGAAFNVDLGTKSLTATSLTAATVLTDTVIAENLYFNSVPYDSLICTSLTSGQLTNVQMGNNMSFFEGELSVTNAALTRTNDTNVTLTLGGSPTTALLAATSLTLGWTGTLAASRGGTGASTQTNNGICYYDGTKLTTSAYATLSFIAGDVDLFVSHPSVSGTSYEVLVTSSSCQYLMAYNTVSTFQGICGTAATENYWTLSTKGIGLFVSASTLWFGTTSNDDLSLYRNNTERLKLTSSGVYIPNALSVGTTTTSRTVQIGTPTATGSLAGNRFVLSDFTASTLELYQSTAENQWRSNLAIGLSANNSATSQLYISTGGLVSITGTISDSVSRFEVFDTNNLGITINAPTPRYNMYESDAALNEKWWDVLAISGTLSYRVVNDAQSSAATFMQVDRTGITIDSVAFPGGKVAIGTTSPSTLLTVAAGTEATDYGKCIQTVRPAASALHMAMIREGTYKWGIGYLYNTNTFGIFNSLSSTDASNTSAALAINSSGNVGVGENTPNFAMVARYTGTIAQISARYDGTSPSNHKELQLGYNGATGSGYGWIQSIHNGAAYTALSLNPNGGNIGVGTSGPLAKFHVLETSGTDDVIFQRNGSGGTSDSIKIANDGTVSTITGDNEEFKISHSAGTYQYFKGGNFGIGKTDPQEKLDMGSGKIRFYSSTDYQNVFANTWGINVFTSKLTGSGLRIGEIYGNLGLYSGDGSTSYHLGLYAPTGYNVYLAPNNTVAMTLDSNGNVVACATSALATNATNGFLYIRTCAGTPTGAPTAFTGHVAMVFDTTNSKLYCYNGAWKSVTLT